MKNHKYLGLDHFQWINAIIAFPWALAGLIALAALLFSCGSKYPHNPRYPHNIAPIEYEF